jgi:hypothetical protein
MLRNSLMRLRFHEVEPQEGLALMPPGRTSHAVVRGGSRRIPRPRLGENTLQLADELVVTQAPDGTWFVAVRCVICWPLRCMIRYCTVIPTDRRLGPPDFNNKEPTSVVFGVGWQQPPLHVQWAGDAQAPDETWFVAVRCVCVLTAALLLWVLSSGLWAAATIQVVVT